MLAFFKTSLFGNGKTDLYVVCIVMELIHYLLVNENNFDYLFKVPQILLKLRSIVNNNIPFFLNGSKYCL